MEIGYPVTSCEGNRQESFKRHVPITYRTFYEGQPTVLGARARSAVERRPRHRDFARNAVAMTQQLNAMRVRMFKRQSVYAKRK